MFYTSNLLEKVVALVYLYVRPLLKWFLHKFTNLCEMQRICYGMNYGSKRTKAVEKSLTLSRTAEIRELVKSLNELTSESETTDEQFLGDVIERAVETVMRVKHIKPKANPEFAQLFETCVEQIYGYKRLYYMVESLRTTQYDSDNPQHEEKLLKLWKILMPETKLENRITKQWQDIGFQVLLN